MSCSEVPLTREDVQKVIEKSIGPRVSVVDFHLTPYSDRVLGLLGAHRDLVVEVSPKQTRSYFVKSVPYDIEARAKFVTDGKIFRKEASFYGLVMPELMASSDDKSWAPQCYLAKNDVLVLENLRLKNYQLRGKFLDAPSLKAALSSLARLHSASILAETRLGRTFDELHPEVVREIVYTRDGPFARGIGLGIDTAKRVAESLGLNNRELVGRAVDAVFEMMQRPSKRWRNVLCHGDVWSNNFMFSGSKCALVDFQLMRYAPAMTDVAQLIYHNAKKELRDESEVDLLTHYHEVLCETLRRGGEAILPKFEDLLEEYEERRIVGIVTISLCFPMNRLDEETLAEMVAKPERLDRLMAGDRANVVFELMEKNEKYKELIEATVRELVEEAGKLFE